MRSSKFLSIYASLTCTLLWCSKIVFSIDSNNGHKSTQEINHSKTAHCETCPTILKPQGHKPIIDDSRFDGIHISVLKDLRSFFDRQISAEGSLIAQEFNHVWSNTVVDGEQTFKFFSGLANSSTFKREIWQKFPLFIPYSSPDRFCDMMPMGPLSFTIKDDLKPFFDNGIRFPRMVRSTSIEKGSWYPAGIVNDNKHSVNNRNRSVTEPTYFYWKDIEDSLYTPTTVHLDSMSKFIPKLSVLAKLTNTIFGLPSIINIYLTPFNLTESTPPHTDPQDVFILQTVGCKHWKIYSRPDASFNTQADPFNRGKVGDILTEVELDGRKLIDVILKPGDFLYIPKGFPHSTNTILNNSLCGNDLHFDSDEENDDMKGKYSLHLTLGIETHDYSLTYGHLRWILLSRAKKSLGTLNVGMKGHWEAMDTLPLGFLGNGESSSSNMKKMRDKMRELLKILEPRRWKVFNENKIQLDGREDMPETEDLNQAIEYIRNEHLPSILELYDLIFQMCIESDFDDVINIQESWDLANRKIMERFWTFGDDEYMRKYYTN